MLCSLMKLLRSNVRFASGSALLPPRTTAAALPAHGRCLHNPLLHRSTGVSAWRTATRCQASGLCCVAPKCKYTLMGEKC